MPQGRPLRDDRDQLVDERHLVEAAQQNPERFAGLYELYFERIYAYVVSRVRDRSEAQDVTSEVFHQALANIRRFEWRGVPFSAWLFRIAANAIADRVQRLSREENPSADIASDVDMEKEEQRAQIFRLVKKLPDDQRRVVELRFVEQRSIKEIA